MGTFKRGDLVQMDGLLAVVVGAEGEPTVPDEHLALSFGPSTPQVRTSKGGAGTQTPEVWMVPAYLCQAAPAPVICH